MGNQSAKHANLLTALATTGLTYEQAWHAYWDSLAVASGNFNERMLAWINGVLTTSYQDLPRAMQAYADNEGAYNWDSLDDLNLPP